MEKGRMDAMQAGPAFDNGGAGEGDAGNESVSVAGIVLAAGQSSRMRGLCKLVLPVRGVPLLLLGIRSMAPWCDRVVVVTGAHAETVGLALGACPFCERVHNPQPESGMIVSAKAALRLLLDPSDGKAVPDRIFLLPGDCAFVDPKVYGALLASARDVAMPTFGGQAGHPVLLSTTAARGILAASDETTIQQLLAGYRTEKIEVADDGILEDLDTLEGYERILRRMARQPGGSVTPPVRPSGRERYSSAG